MRAVTWNVEWATPRSRRTTEILSRIDGHAPEVVCLTETDVGLLSQRGHSICSQPDAGYEVKMSRRKVILWSREPWDEVDDAGLDSMPPGRFVAGVTRTSLGKVTVIGVCIPWFGSRTEARRKAERKMRWEDHEQYLAGLTEILRRASAKRLIVMGGLQSSYRNKQPSTSRTATGAKEGVPCEHENRYVRACLPGTQKHRPHCSE